MDEMSFSLGDNVAIEATFTLIDPIYVKSNGSSDFKVSILTTVKAVHFSDASEIYFNLPTWLYADSEDKEYAIKVFSKDLFISNFNGTLFCSAEIKRDEEMFFAETKKVKITNLATGEGYDRAN